MEAKLNVAVFISGGGTNLQSLIDAAADPDYPARIAVVISSSKKAYGLTRAENAGIPGVVLRKKDFESKEAYTVRLLEVLKEHDTDVICLAGYLKLIPPEVVRAYRNRILNIHPALLPKFGGKGMYGLRVHQAVLEAGETVSGPTVHVVDEIYDNGEILAQREVSVIPGEEPESLQKRVLEQEHKVYPEVLRRVCEEIQSGKR